MGTYFPTNSCSEPTENVTGFEKTRLPQQLQIFRNTEFNYLKYYNLGRKADSCMKFATIL